MRRKFYLAGPFFNTAQLKLQMDIETAFVDTCVPFFSPRLQPQNEQKILTPEAAQQIFTRNFEEIHACSDMLAVIDWSMPVGQSVVPMIVKSANEGALDFLLGNPLNIPDTGTVWELGVAYTMQYNQRRMSELIVGGKCTRRIWMFTMRGPEDKLNLMLTRSADGVIYGLEELGAFLNRGEINESVAKPWAGLNI